MKKTILLLISALVLTTLQAQENQDINIDKTYKINPTGILHIDTDDANVKITGADRDDIHVMVFRRLVTKGIVMGDREFSIEINDRYGDLYIEDFEENSSFGIVGYMEEEYRISIEMPQTMNLKIKGDDGDYRIANANGEIRMNVDDADARLSNCKGNYFDLDFDDGDIIMDMGSGFLRLSIDDGDFEAANANFTEIEANTDDGDIVLETSIANNGNYSFSIDDGSVDLSVLSGGGEFTIYHEDSSISSSTSFERKLNEDSRTVLNLNGGTGKVKMRTDDGRIRLRTL